MVYWYRIPASCGDAQYGSAVMNHRFQHQPTGYWNTFFRQAKRRVTSAFEGRTMYSSINVLAGKKYPVQNLLALYIEMYSSVYCSPLKTLPGCGLGFLLPGCGLGKEAAPLKDSAIPDE